VSAAVMNVVIGLITSVVSGAGVWAWQRVARARFLDRERSFFGIGRGGTCLVVMNHKWSKPGSMDHEDVQALIEVATLAREAGAELEVRSCDEIHESNGDRTEFCVGGPASNPRTDGHLAAHLPGVRQRPFGTRRDAGALMVGTERFGYEPDRHVHALVAKFTPAGATRPVILICGQTAVANRAAVLFLKREYRKLMKKLAAIDRFCLILRIVAPKIYGPELAELHKDVTAAAFAPRPTAQAQRPTS
jgi:hypothetical protein